MKYSLFGVMLVVGAAGVANAYIVSDIRSNEGDSAHYYVNRNYGSNVDLNIRQTHMWDMTAPFGSEEMETMMITSVDQGYFGSRFPYAQWLVRDCDYENNIVDEAYMGRDENAVLIYGYGYDVTGSGLLGQYDGQTGDSLYVFPLTLGKRWDNVQRATSGDTIIITRTAKEIVDEGEIITAKGTFPCIVMRMEFAADLYLYGFHVGQKHYYQYDWLSDTLGTLAAIRSRDGERNEVFSTAGRTQRIKDFWLTGGGSGGISTDDADDFFLEVLPGSNGILVRCSPPGEEKARLYCYEASGRRLWSESLPSLSGAREFRIKGLSRGIYFLRLEAESGARTARCVVVR